MTKEEKENFAHVFMCEGLEYPHTNYFSTLEEALSDYNEKSNWYFGHPQYKAVLLEAVNGEWTKLDWDKVNAESE